MDLFYDLRIRLTILGLEIHDLSANHAVYGSSPSGDLFDNAHAPCSLARQLTHNFVGICLKRIAREDRNGFTKDDMTGRLAPSQIVIVECGKIIVDQRIS